MNPDLYENPPEKTPKGRSGCMTASIIVLVLLVLGATFIVLNFKKLAARAIAHMIEKSIEGSDIAPEQKSKLIARVTALRDNYLAGRVTDDQLKQVAREIGDSPLLLVGTVYHLDTNYVQPSGLSADEKLKAKMTLERVARGVHEKKIAWAKLDPIFRVISTTNAEGKRELKKQVTDGELREFLTLAEREADKAGIPHEPMQIDLAEELDKAIERGLKGEERPF